MFKAQFLLHTFIRSKLMESKDIIIELIEQLSTYEKETRDSGSDISLNDFLGYLNLKYQAQNIRTQQMGGELQDWSDPAERAQNTDISILIVLMFRYAKGYIKKALKDSVINTADEFSYLITLMTYESLIKTELIHKQIMEKTSGTEILNRLIRAGLIEQFSDNQDKRSVRVKISQKGREEILAILPQMRKVSDLISAVLDENEKNTMGYMLRKLESFHNDIYINKKETELDREMPNKQVF